MRTEAEDGKPHPIHKKHKIKFGVLKGKIKISKDFDAPLPDEVLNEFDLAHKGATNEAF